MEKFYSSEFIMAFLYNELPFSAKRAFVKQFSVDPTLRQHFYDLKNAKENLLNFKLKVPSPRLVNYIRNYAATFEQNNFCVVHNN